MDSYRRNGHTKHSLKVHLILVTKYRKKIFLSNKMQSDIKQFIYDCAKRYNYTILQMETDKDHIHILLEYNPKDSISTIVKILKQYSTYQMWKYHSYYLTKLYWKGKILWSDGYFACSIGQVSQAIIEQYIKNQG